MSNGSYLPESLGDCSTQQWVGNAYARARGSVLRVDAAVGGTHVGMTVIARKLVGRVGLVTGAGRGIGRAVPVKLASEGARVVVNDLDEGPAEDTVKPIAAAGGEGVGCAGSVTAVGFAERFVTTSCAPHPSRSAASRSRRRPRDARSTESRDLVRLGPRRERGPGELLRGEGSGGGHDEDVEQGMGSLSRERQLRRVGFIDPRLTQPLSGAPGDHRGGGENHRGRRATGDARVARDPDVLGDVGVALLAAGADSQAIRELAALDTRATWDDVGDLVAAIP